MPFDFDFIGLQNYTREVLKYVPYVPFMKGKFISAEERNADHTAMAWEIYPEGLYNLLRKMNSYGKISKLIVTEWCLFPGYT